MDDNVPWEFEIYQHNRNMNSKLIAAHLAVLLVLLTFGSDGSPISENSTLATKWKPPKDWHLKFPYYITGFDFEGRPVFVIEYGKWNIRSKITAGGASATAMRNYFDQMAEDAFLIGEAFQDVDGVVLVVDFQGFTQSSLTHGPTLFFLFNMFGSNVGKVTAVFHEGIGLNINYAAQSLFSVAGSLLGPMLARFEMLGTNMEKWAPKLRSVVPRSQLPPWYTGNRKDWKPLQVLGQGALPDIEMLRREQARFEDEALQNSGFKI